MEAIISFLGSLDGSIYAIFGILTSIFLLVCWYRIITKMGFPGIAVLLFLIPIVNFIFFIYLAFGEWPNEKYDYNGNFDTKSGIITGEEIKKMELKNSWICKRCQQENSSSSQFCSGCGAYK